MNMAVRFDTFHYAQILREAGVPESQVEGHIRAQAFALQDSLPDVLATREDLLQLEQRLSGRIVGLDNQLSGKIADLDKRQSLGFEGLGNRLDRYLWLNGLVLVVVTAVAAKLFLR